VDQKILQLAVLIKVFVENPFVSLEGLGAILLVGPLVHLDEVRILLCSGSEVEKLLESAVLVFLVGLVDFL